MLSTLIAIIITLVTAGVFLLLGIWYIRGSVISIEDYIVSRNTAGTGLAIATLVASGLGGWILFAPAETGTLAGITGLVGYGIGSAAPLVAFVFLGSRMRQLMPRGHSVTEYVQHRFGPVVYYFVLFVVIFYMLVFLTAELTGMAQAGQLIGGTPLVVTAIIVGLLTVTYTAYGGMRASLFTDRIQFYVILPLLALVIIAGVGGSREMLSAASENVPELLSLGNLAGWEYGVALIIAILAAGLRGSRRKNPTERVHHRRVGSPAGNLPDRIVRHHGGGGRECGRAVGGYVLLCGSGHAALVHSRTAGPGYGAGYEQYGHSVERDNQRRNHRAGPLPK